MTGLGISRIAVAGVTLALAASFVGIGAQSASAVKPETPVTGFTVWQGGNAYPSPTSVVLQWNRWAPVDDQDPILHYEVSWGGGQKQNCPDSSNGTVYCTITGLTTGNDYSFSIIPHKATGDGPSANMLSPSTVTPYGEPDQPAAPAISTVTPSAVTLGITAPAGNGRAISRYEIYQSRDGGNYDLQTSTTSLAPTISGLDTAAHVYRFKVRAINVGGPGTLTQAPEKASPLSDSSAATATVPSAPTNVLVSGVGVNPSTATVTWTAPPGVPDHPVSSYEVTAEPGGQTCIVPSATVSCTYSGGNALATGSTYTFTVTATNDLGESAASIPSSPVLIGATASAPQSLSGTVGDAQVRLEWAMPQTNGDTAITGYRIERASSGAGPWVVEVANSGDSQTQRTITGLTNGQNYYFRVSAINGSGAGAQATSAAFKPGTVPSAPTNLTASRIQVDPSSITLNWTAAADPTGYPVTGYVVTALPGGTQCVVPTATVTCTFVGSNALTAGSAYTFRVSAVNALGTGAASISSGEYLLGVPAGPVGNLTAAPTSGGATVSWNPPTSEGGTPVSGYRVQYSSSASGPWTTAVANTQSVNPVHQVTGLQNGIAYYFRVTPINASGLGAGAVSAAAVQPGIVPPAPTNVVAGGIQADPSTATVSWTAPPVPAGSEVTGYTVTALPGGMTCQSVTTSCTFANVNALTVSTWYSFKVTATNDFGTSPVSIESIAYLIEDSPAAPGSLVATPADSEVKLSWTPPAGVVTSYQVYSSTASAGGPWNVVSMNTASLNTNFVVAGLTNGTGYWFRVVATNASGPGAAAVSAQVTPGGAPGSPRQIAVTDVTSTSITAAWLPISDGRGGTVSYTLTAFPGGQTCATAGTSCTVSGLTPGISYQLWVASHNAFGSSDPFLTPAPVSAGTFPATPVAPAAKATGPGAARISWAASSVYGAAPVSYLVKLGNKVVCTTSATSCVVKGLTTKSATFSLQARNQYGDSVAAAATATGIKLLKISLSGMSTLAPKVVVVGAAPKKVIKVVQVVRRPEGTYKYVKRAKAKNSKKVVIPLRKIYGPNTLTVSSGGVSKSKSWNWV